MANELKTPETIKTFLLAGKAVLTVENTATNVRFTYKVRKAKTNPKFPGETWFVSVLTGSNNEADYSSLGMLKNGGFRSYNGTGVAPAAKSYVAFRWLWSRVAEGKTLPETVVVRHEGHCCRCGRLLTVPESLDRGAGIGPECAKAMGWKKEPASRVASPNLSTTSPSSAFEEAEPVGATAVVPAPTLEGLKEMFFAAYAPGESTGPRSGISIGN